MLLIPCPLTEGLDFYEKFYFPAGEMHLKLNPKLLHNEKVRIQFNFKKIDDIYELLLLAHTLHFNKISIDNLYINYFPFAQADRVNFPGECFSLRLFCDLINNVVKPDCVTIYDPHSDVTPALLNNVNVVYQWELLAPIINNIYKENSKNFVLVCPDAGAEKKTNKLAQQLMQRVVYCRKIRSTLDGQITGTQVDVDDLKGYDAVIVDDCVVGGRTFIEIAKIIRQRNVA